MKSNLGSALSGAQLAALLLVAPVALAQQSPIYGERDLVHPVYGKQRHGRDAGGRGDAGSASRCSGTAATPSMRRRRSRSRSR